MGDGVFIETEGVRNSVPVVDGDNLLNFSSFVSNTTMDGARFDETVDGE